MTSKTQRFLRWIVEGSNGEIILGPSSLEDALKAIDLHDELANRTCYSASGPMPSNMAKAIKDSRLGYLLRKVEVKVVETYE